MSRIVDSESLWSSAQVAAAFGVGVSSIKRWTDQGRLESVKTIGGHRRYRLEAIYAFARREGLPTTGLPPLELDIEPGTTTEEEIIEILLAELDDGDVDLAGRTITGYLGRATDPVGFLDRVVGELLSRVGQLWATGAWTVEKEHRASYCIAEAIDRARRPDAPEGEVALLACPPDELHSLPLNMLRFLLAANGRRSDFLGANVPWESLQSAVVRRKPRLVLLTARSEVPFNSPEFTRFEEACRKARASVCVGGAWARGGMVRNLHVRRFRSLSGFERWLRSSVE
jgi:MerR family transcriptional regulator, light-induced transcriptional regulator